MQIQTLPSTLLPDVADSCFKLKSFVKSTARYLPILKEKNARQTKLAASWRRKLDS